jgi:hypothetical protein
MPDNTPPRLENTLDRIVPPRGRSFTEIGAMIRFLSESDRRAFRDYINAEDSVAGVTYRRPDGTSRFLRPDGTSTYLRPA